MAVCSNTTAKSLQSDHLSEFLWCRNVILWHSKQACRCILHHKKASYLSKAMPSARDDWVRTKCHNDISAVGTYTLESCGFLFNEPHACSVFLPSHFLFQHLILHKKKHSSHCCWIFQELMSSLQCAKLVKQGQRRKGLKTHRDAFQKEPGFWLGSDSILKRGWDFGCRCLYNRNNEMWLRGKRNLWNKWIVS